MIAASLKQYPARGQRQPGAAFPRSDDRGLIEAMRSPSPLTVGSHFRDQMIAASLKLLCCLSVLLWYHYFRDQMIAASLKPIDCSTDFYKQGHFRDQMIAASLKQAWEEPALAMISDFRDQMIAASLKPLLTDWQ